MFTLPAAKLPRKKHSLQGRRLVVVDIENVAGGAVVSLGLARWARDTVVSALQIRHEDQVVVATSHIGFLNTSAAWPSARIKVRSGRDGADVELLQVLMSERVEERFDEVLLVSGDGIFASTVARLGGRGVGVTVASWNESLSARLRLATGRVVLLEQPASGHRYREIA
jgi:hypothetical protein